MYVMMCVVVRNIVPDVPALFSEGCPTHLYLPTSLNPTHKGTPSLATFQRLRKIAKSHCLLHHVGLPGRPRGTTRLPLDGFS